MSILSELDVLSKQSESSLRRPRILFLSQTLPFPPDVGVNIRSYNILRLLARHFDITALYFFRKASLPTDASVQASLARLRDFGAASAFAIPQEHSMIRFAVDHLRSVLRGRPYTYYAYEAADFRGALGRLLRSQDFDLVHIDSLDLCAYLPMLKGMPVICTHHNIESDLLERMSTAEDSRWKSRYMLHQAMLTRKEEAKWCHRVSLNIVVSPNDEHMLKRIAPQANVVVVPNGVDTATFRPGGSAQAGLVFVGGYDWLPNRDAMSFFAHEILPLLRSTGKDVAMTWVGRAPISVQNDYARMHGVKATGYVDDVRPYIDEAACYVAPLRAGGGTRLKILDAWAMGKAVVSTHCGCEGLAAVDGKNILIRDNPEDFADAVRSVLDNVDLRQSLGAAGRHTVESQYEWEVIGERLHREYYALLPSSVRIACGIV